MKIGSDDCWKIRIGRAEQISLLIVFSCQSSNKTRHYSQLMTYFPCPVSCPALAPRTPGCCCCPGLPWPRSWWLCWTWTEPGPLDWDYLHWPWLWTFSGNSFWTRKSDELSWFYHWVYALVYVSLIQSHIWNEDDFRGKGSQKEIDRRLLKRRCQQFLIIKFDEGPRVSRCKQGQGGKGSGLTPLPAINPATQIIIVTTSSSTQP